MNRIWTTVMAGAAATAALAQSGVLYAPVRSIEDQGIVLRTWGSGAISQTDEAAYEGVYSLRIGTRNYFQGGILHFANTPDLSTMFADKNNLLRLTFRLADLSLTLGGGSRGPGGTNKGGDVIGGDQGLSGAGTSKGGGAGSQIKPSGLQNMRFVITTTDGKKSEAYVAITTSTGSDRGWSNVAVPLQAIRGFDKTNKIVSSIALAGDATSVFYVGDLRVVNDSTPIRGEANVEKLNLALGDEIELHATGFGGSSILIYNWDFDEKDGLQVEAEGQVIKHKFRKPGKFIVTVTIADQYGLKKPTTAKIEVTVNP